MVQVIRKVLCAVALSLVLLVPASVAYATPTGYVAYETETVQIGTVDVGAGAPSVTNVGSTGVSATGASVTGVGLAPSGVLYLTEGEGDRLLTVDPATGALIDSVDLDFSASNSQPVITSDGTVYVFNGGALTEVDLETGHGTLRAEFPAGVTGGAARCIDSSGTNELFAFASGPKQLYRVSLPSFTITPLPQALGSITVNSTKIAFDASGTLWGMNVAASPPTIMTIDTTTGVGTAVGAGGVTGYYGLAIAAASCPSAPPSPPDGGDGTGAPPVVVTPNFTG
jgi:hypothetical protein